jgi:heptosyltransferase-2
MPERILVRLPNWLGDLMLSRPLLHALRAARPGAEAVAVAPRPLLDLVSAEGLFERLHSWTSNGSERSALLREVRAWRPDVALVLPPSFSSALFAWRSGARRRIGYRHDGRAALLSRALRRRPRGDLHLSLEYLALGDELGVRPIPVPRLVVPVQGVERSAALLGRLRAAGDRLALLAPGAAYGPAKRWPLDRFVAVARHVVRRGLAALVCGAASERAVCEQVAREAGSGVASVAGETDLPAQAALCARAALVVSNDSGLAHLAAAAGAPTVVVFGSTSSAWTAPLGPRVRVLQHAPVCAPCFQRRCRIGYRCLEAVTVEEVRRACDELVA